MLFSLLIELCHVAYVYIYCYLFILIIYYYI